MDHLNCVLDKLSFVHIPKTAGISLHSELEKHFGKEKTIRFGDKKRRNLFLSMETDQLKKYNYITGHILLPELIQKGINYPTISVMRDPVRRLVSLQHYMTNSNLSDHNGCNFKNFDDCLQYLFSNNSCNVQCWHLCGRGNFDAAVDSIRTNNIFVAPLEYYQDLIDTLSNLLGTHIDNIHKNITKYKDSVEDTDNLNHTLLDPLIGEDKKLFSYVKNNYENIKQEFIKHLPK